MSIKAAALITVFVLGAALRIVPVALAQFPLNDGGLFLTMAEDLRANGMVVPAYTSYNDAGIPFAYPPLGLYLVALLRMGGMSGTDALTVAAVTLSIATIPVVYQIGREVLGSWPMGTLTAAFFAFSTGSYRFLIMGGGVTRSLGFLMALLAVYFALRLYRTQRPSAAIIGGLALGAAVMSHPQAAVFGGLSVAVLFFVVPASKRAALPNLLMLSTVAALAALPWASLILAEHGPDPFLSAARTGGAAFLGVVSLAGSRTSGGYLEIIGIATSLGLVICVLRGFWLPPVWILAIAIVDSRAGQPYISVPAALAIAFLLADIGRVIGRSDAHSFSLGARRRALAVAVCVAVGAAFLDSLAGQSVPGSPLRALPDETREAMAWVGARSEPDARFVVVSGWHWALDAEAEWFPTLTGRRNLTTVQGTEWQGRFVEQVERAGELPGCIAADDQECIRRWFTNVGEVNYLFLVKTPSIELAPSGLGDVECCHQLAGQLSELYETEIVHREGAVLVVRLTPRSS